MTDRNSDLPPAVRSLMDDMARRLVDRGRCKLTAWWLQDQAVLAAFKRGDHAEAARLRLAPWTDFDLPGPPMENPP